MGTPSLDVVRSRQPWNEIACDCQVLTDGKELTWGSGGRICLKTCSISSVWKLCAFSHCKKTGMGWFLLGQLVL